MKHARHPQHYQGAHEHWDCIIAWGLDYLLGCTTKYIYRAGRKEGVTAIGDLEKAREYLNRKILALRYPGVPAKQAERQARDDKDAAEAKAYWHSQVDRYKVELDRNRKMKPWRK